MHGGFTSLAEGPERLPVADWFKFYENDLDETRLQYAISKLPEVIPVWVGILSEACRHKSGTVSWGDDSIELFGFSRRLGISVPKVNEAVVLLCEIRYITRANSHITVTKWDEKQSEYCQKKTRLQNQSKTVSGHTPDSVRQEERRGEEKRVEEIRIKTPPVGFEEFWEAYPRRIGKGKASKQFESALKRTNLPNMLKAIESQKHSDQWRKDGGQFIPHPATWLSQDRWLDVVQVDVATRTVGGRY